VLTGLAVTTKRWSLASVQHGGAHAMGKEGKKVEVVLWACGNGEKGDGARMGDDGARVMVIGFG